ncbi:unnamed protein product [Mesocestoides corti]|uniref:SH2 domain-containing protein n=1 Tax=Mesocestoides corti TaxID=53468 RepID=A0A158QW06_MESCO|nr:unnamed protein product [Mesocestoides corti]
MPTCRNSDPAIKSASSLGALPRHRESHNFRLSPQDNMRQLAQWRCGSSSSTPTVNENAILGTLDKWFRPSFSRDASIDYLKGQPPGSFVIRTSSRYPGFYGLTIKTEDHGGNDGYNSLEDGHLIKHYLIGETSDGYYQIQGTKLEPEFKRLADLVGYHCQYLGALPCVLRLPDYAEVSKLNNLQNETQLPPTKYKDDKIFDFQVLYLGTFEVFSSVGSNAISSAMDILFRTQNSRLRPILVAFRVSPEGVTLTDLHCRQFIRRHLSRESVVYVGADPYGRKIFGLVIRASDTSGILICHLFAQQFNTQPCEFIVECVKNALCQSSLTFLSILGRMRLFTHNILTSRVLKSVKVGYPLAIKAVKVEVTPADFEAAQTARFIPKIEWSVLKSAVEQVSLILQFFFVRVFLHQNHFLKDSG